MHSSQPSPSHFANRVKRLTGIDLRWCLGLTLIALLLLTATGAQAERFFVDATANGLESGLSWQDAFTDLQTALDSALDGDEIWVACAIYSPTVRSAPGNPTTAQFFVRSGISLIGGFNGGESLIDQRNPDPQTNGCVLGAPETLDGVRRIMIVDNVSAVVVIDGFALLGSPTQSEFINRGAGIFVRDSDFIGRNLRFADLATASGSPGLGAGIFVQRATVDLDQVLMENLENGRGSITALGAEATVTASRLTIRNTIAGFGGGGAIFISQGASVEVSDSLFENNTGANNGGAVLKEDGSFIVSRSRFLENAARRGGAMRLAGSGLVTIDNSELIGNRANGAGGAAIAVENNTNLVVTNSNIVSNQGSDASIFVRGSGFVTLQNSIIYANLANDGSVGPQILVADTSTSDLSVTHSIVDGGFIGTGNLDLDPAFVRAPSPTDDDWGTLSDNDLGDLRLTDSSPAIDAGSNDVDIDGNGAATLTAVDLALDLDRSARRVDILEVPDTGTGNTPIIDIGAREAFTVLFSDSFEFPVEAR